MNEFSKYKKKCIYSLKEKQTMLLESSRSFWQTFCFLHLIWRIHLPPLIPCRYYSFIRLIQAKSSLHVQHWTLASLDSGLSGRIWGQDLGLDDLKSLITGHWTLALFRIRSLCWTLCLWASALLDSKLWPHIVILMTSPSQSKMEYNLINLQ